MTIAPGIFWTPMVDGMPEAVQQSLAASIPFPSRLGKPEEFADLVAYILRQPLPQRRDHPPRRRGAPGAEVSADRDTDPNHSGATGLPTARILFTNPEQ